MATARYQAAADKTGIGHAVPQHQFTQAVTQQNLGAGRWHLSQAVPRDAQAGLGQQAGHDIETFRVAWNQYQQGVGRTREMPHKGFDQRLILSGMGAARSQYRPLRQRVAELVYFVAQLGGQPDIGFDVAGDLHPLRGYPQCFKAAGRGRVLGADQFQRRQGRRHQALPARIGGGRLHREARVDECDRNTQAFSPVQEVGP